MSDFAKWLASEARAISRGTFSVIHIMSDSRTVHQLSRVEWLWPMLLLVVDMMQVLRDILSPQYGWNDEIKIFFESTDFAATFHVAHEGVIAFAIFCDVLIFLVIVTAVFVMLQFRSGHMTQFWAAKLLRYMGAIVVTSFYPTIFQYSLMPATCDFWIEKTSAREPATACEIFFGARGVFAVVAIMLASFLFLFGLLLSLFFLEINPVNQNPISMFLGRTEAAYLTLKTGFIVVPLLSGTDTNTIPLAIVALTLFSLLTWCLHIYELPFHTLPANVLRGMMFGAATGMLFSACIAVFGAGFEQINPAAAAITVIGGAVGVGATIFRQRRAVAISAQLKLDAEFNRDTSAELGSGDGVEDHHAPDNDARDAELEAGSEAGAPAGPWPVSAANGAGTATGADIGQVLRRWYAAHRIPVSISQAVGIRVPLGYQSDAFFTKGFGKEAKGRLMRWSDMDAVVACRALLEHRDYDQLANIRRVLIATASTTRDCVYTALWLAAFALFVVQDYVLCARILDELDNRSLRLGAAYLRFGLRQKMAQLQQQLSLGNEMTAIGMLEAQKAQEAAVQHHAAAVRALRMIWKELAKGTDLSLVVKHVADWSSSVERARNAFQELLEKFPQSTMLHRSFAQFLEDVTNETSLAREMRAKAERLDDGNTIDDDQEQKSVSSDRQKSVSSRSSRGSTASRKTAIDDWGATVLSMESEAIREVQRTVRIGVMVLLVCLIVGFIVMDLVLFSRSAESSISNIRLINSVRNALIAAFGKMRDVVTTAAAGDEFTMAAARAVLQVSAADLSTIIVGIHAKSTSYVQGILLESVRMRMPVAGGTWKFAHVPLFEMLRGLPEHVLTANTLDHSALISPGVWDNSTRLDVLRARSATLNIAVLCLPLLDDLGMHLEIKLAMFGQDVWVAAAVIASVTVILALTVISIVESNLGSATTRLRTAATVATIGVSIPRAAVKNIARHYSQLEERVVARLKEDPDDDLSIKDILDLTPRSPVSPRTSTLRSPSSKPPYGYQSSPLRARQETSAGADGLAVGWQVSQKEDMSTVVDSDANGLPVIVERDETQATGVPLGKPAVAPGLASPVAGRLGDQRGAGGSDCGAVGVLVDEAELDGDINWDEVAELDLTNAKLPLRLSSGARQCAHQGNESGNAFRTPTTQAATAMLSTDDTDGTLLPSATQPSPLSHSADELDRTEFSLASPSNAVLLRYAGVDTNTRANTNTSANANGNANTRRENWGSKPNIKLMGIEDKDDNSADADSSGAGKRSSRQDGSTVKFDAAAPQVRVFASPHAPCELEYARRIQGQIRKVNAKTFLSAAVFGVVLMALFTVVAVLLVKEGSILGVAAADYFRKSELLRDIKTPSVYLLECYLNALELALVPKHELRAAMDRYHERASLFKVKAEEWSTFFSDKEASRGVLELTSSGFEVLKVHQTVLFPALATGNHTLIMEAYEAVRAEHQVHMYIIDNGNLGGRMNDILTDMRTRIGSTALLRMILLAAFICLLYLSGLVAIRHPDQVQRLCTGGFFRRFRCLRFLCRKLKIDTGGNRVSAFSHDSAGVPSPPLSPGMRRKLRRSTSFSAVAPLDIRPTGTMKLAALFGFCISLQVLVFLLLARGSLAGSQEFDDLVAMNRWMNDFNAPYANFLEGYTTQLEGLVMRGPAIDWKECFLCAFQHKYAYWAGNIDGDLWSETLTECYNTGLTVGLFATKNLQEAIAVGPDEALAAWPKMRRLYDVHASATRRASAAIEDIVSTNLMKVYQAVLLAKVVIPVAAAMSVMFFVCFMRIFCDSTDHVTPRARSMLASSGTGLEKMAKLFTELRTSGPTFMRAHVRTTVYVLLPALAVMAVAIPLRHISDIVNIGPLIDQVSRRNAMVHLATLLLSEAAFGDRWAGIDALTLATMASDLTLRAATVDRAVREGGTLNIITGTDFNFPAIDNIMYTNEGVVTPVPETSPFYSMVNGGLHHATSALMNSVVSLSATIKFADLEPIRSRPFGSGNAIDYYVSNICPVVPTAGNMWTMDAEHRSTMLGLRNLVQPFVTSRSDEVEQVLVSEFSNLFALIHFEIRLLFGATIFFVFVVFFLGVFTQTTNALQLEIARSRGFVTSMPIHLLSQGAMTNLRDMLSDANDQEKNQSPHQGPVPWQE